jgi:hypothetical protein
MAFAKKSFLHDVAFTNTSNLPRYKFHQHPFVNRSATSTALALLIIKMQVVFSGMPLEKINPFSMYWKNQFIHQ